jgi:hypothetical protein
MHFKLLFDRVKFGTTQLAESAFISVVLLVFVSSCIEEAVNFTPDCAGASYTFAADIAPVVQSNCAINSGCHGTGSHQGPGELLTYAQVFDARSSIRSALSSGRMPKTGTISVAQKNAIICWIDNGAAVN